MSRHLTYVVIFVFVLASTLFSTSAFAQTRVSGNIVMDTMWTLAGSPYVIREGDVVVGEQATLTIEPGVVVKLLDCNIKVQGTLNARGTQIDRIIFTSFLDDSYSGDTNNDAAKTSPSAGNWGIITFADTSHNCILENCVIQYGGKASKAVVWMDSTSPAIRGCIFQDNKSYVMSMDLPSHPVVEDNTVSRNGYNGILIRSGSYTQDGVWDCTNIPYILQENISLEESCRLTISPGVVVKLYGYKDWGWHGYNINVKGTLKAQGTQSDPVVFTSHLDDVHGGDTNNDKATTSPESGNWGSIRFYDTSRNCVLEHCIIRYGGAGLAAIWMDGTSPTIANCELKYNKNGISCNSRSAPQILGNLISKCDSKGVHCADRSAPIIHDNSIYDNGESGVENADDSVVIDAQGNWWGDPTGPFDGSDDQDSGGWHNPEGLGDKVSNYVDYTSWLESEPSLPIEVPFSGDEPEIARHTYTLTLHQGLNMVSPPLKPDSGYTARSFCEKLGATMILRFDALSQDFEAFVPGVAANSGFPVVGGEGYIVNVLDSKQVTFTGQGWHDPMAAPARNPGENSGAWAFAIGGHFLDICNKPVTVQDRFSVEVRNIDLGITMAGNPGKAGAGIYLTAYCDPTRRVRFLQGQTLEITILSPDGQRICDPIYHRLDHQEIARASAIVPIVLNETANQVILCQNYPNPFNAETWIPYILPASSHVEVKIYNSIGALVRTFELGQKEAGAYIGKSQAIHWDGKSDGGESVSSGIYFCKLTAGDTSRICKLVLRE